jgi:hypothetical protein
LPEKRKIVRILADNSNQFGNHGVRSGETDGVAEVVFKRCTCSKRDALLRSELVETPLDGAQFGGSVAEKSVEIFEGAGVAADVALDEFEVFAGFAAEAFVAEDQFAVSAAESGPRLTR